MVRRKRKRWTRNGRPGDAVRHAMDWTPYRVYSSSRFFDFEGRCPDCGTTMCRRSRRTPYEWPDEPDESNPRTNRTGDWHAVCPRCSELTCFVDGCEALAEHVWEHSFQSDLRQRRTRTLSSRNTVGWRWEWYGLTEYYSDNCLCNGHHRQFRVFRFFEDIAAWGFFAAGSLFVILLMVKGSYHLIGATSLIVDRITMSVVVVLMALLVVALLNMIAKSLYFTLRGFRKKSCYADEFVNSAPPRRELSYLRDHDFFTEIARLRFTTHDQKGRSAYER